MGIGRRPLGRLRRLTPDEDTHTQQRGVSNQIIPRRESAPSSYRFGGKCAVLVAPCDQNGSQAMPFGA